MTTECPIWNAVATVPAAPGTAPNCGSARVADALIWLVAQPRAMTSLALA